MPKKDAAPEDTEPQPLSPFEESNVAISVAHEIIEDIIQRGGDELYEHYLQAKEIILAAKRTVEEMNAIIRSSFLIRDEGEADNEVDWIQDTEPSPASTDSWARGAVPSRKKKSSKFLDGIENQDLAGSVRSSGSRSRRRGASRRRKRRDDDENDSPPTIITRTATPSKPTKVSRGNPAASSAKTLASNEISEFEERAEQDRRRREKLRSKRLEEDQRFLSYKQREDLIDKTYTFDADGELVVIAEPTKLPGNGMVLGNTFDLEPDSRNLDESFEETVAEQQVEVSKVLKKQRKKGKGKGRRRKKAPAPEDNPDWFVEDPSKQPLLMTTIRLSAGVSLKEGSTEKSGPNQQEDPLHMSRTEFSAHQRNLATAKHSDPDDAYSMESSKLDGINYDDFDLTSGARRKTTKNADDNQEYFDPNEELISSADWGSTSNANPHAYDPPLRPARVKDTLHRYEITVGRITQKPRDRPYSRQSTEPEPEKVHLPPITTSPVAQKFLREGTYNKLRYDQTFGARNKGIIDVGNRQTLLDMFGKAP